MTAAAATLARPLEAAVAALGPGPRALSFFNLHTEESLSTTYFDGHQHSPAALDEVNYILRDHRAEQVHPIDPELLDLLYRLRLRLRSREPFHVISGYRSPATNALLRRTRGGGVASGSLHQVGKAIDIRLPGCDLRRLRDTAWELQLGGVGFYPRAEFVHVDTGRVRFWGFAPA